MYTFRKGTLKEAYNRLKSAGQMSFGPGFVREQSDQSESDIRETWTNPEQVRTDVRMFLVDYYTYNRDDLELDAMIKAIQAGIDDAKKVLNI